MCSKSSPARVSTGGAPQAQCERCAGWPERLSGWLFHAGAAGSGQLSTLSSRECATLDMGSIPSKKNDVYTSPRLPAPVLGTLPQSIFKCLEEKVRGRKYIPNLAGREAVCVTQLLQVNVWVCHTLVSWQKLNCFEVGAINAASSATAALSKAHCRSAARTAASRERAPMVHR